MSGESPDVVLYDSSGNPLAVQNGVAISASTPAIISAGSDGTNSRYITVDTSGRQLIVGAGVAGTPAGGVITIQGVSGGTVVPISITGTNTISGTVTANQGTANTLANGWPIEITDGTHGPAAVKAASTAAVATDPALVVAISPNNSFSITAADVTASGALGALNAAVTVTHPGLQSIGMQLAAGTLVGTIVPEISFDGGTTWNQTFFDSPTTSNIVSSIVFGSSNTATAESIVGAGGAGMARVRVSAYTSGTANATVRASDIHDPSILFGGAAGSTLPPIVAQMGGSVTTAAPTYVTATMNALSLTTAGALRIDGSGATQPVSGTVTANAGTGNFTVVQGTAANLNATVTGTVTANIGTTNGLALDTSVNGLLVAQGSTTSGEKGTLTLAAVTTGSPTYTTAQTSPLSLTTAGALRIDGSAVTQPVSGTVTANAGTGNFTVVQATAANLNATVTGTVIVTQATAANLKAQTASESTTATTTGTVAGLVGGAVTTASPTYTTGQMDPLSLTTAGALRVDASATTQPVSGTVTANQGTANTLANAWSTKITDATNGPAAVKAASTAAVATDPALVVAVSPNNTLPIQVADVTATGALGALNAAVQVTLAGRTSVGFQLAAGTLIGTIVAEMSFDGGTTWNTTYFDETAGNKVSSVVFSSANTALGSTMIGVGGAGLARVRVSAYTSGTANVTIRASVLDDPSELYAGISGSTILPPTSVQMAGVYNSTTLQTIAVDTLGRIITSPASALASEAGFANGFVNLTSNTKNFVGSTAYNEQAAGAQRSVSSTSAADTAAGTGAQQVTITWFTSAGAGPNTETVTLNGTTAVNTVSTTMCFIESIVVTRVGSGASNAGTITLFTTTAGGGTAIGTIAIGTNQTFWCHHYVPTGTTCYITGIVAGANNNAGASFITSARSIGVAGAVELQISDFVRNGGGGNASQPSFERSYGTPLNIIGPARINGYVTPDGATTSTYWLSFDFYQQT